MTHVIHINDGVGVAKPIVLHLLPGAEDILEIQVMNHGEPTNIFLEASSSLKKAVRFKKANHFLEQETIVPVLVKMPSKTDRLDGEILVDSDESINRVPITLVREGADSGDDIQDDDDDAPRGRSRGGDDEEDDDGDDLDHARGRNADYSDGDYDSDSNSDGGRQDEDDEESDDDLDGNGHREFKSYGDVPDFSEPSTYKITQVQKSAPRYKITQAVKAQPTVQEMEYPDSSPSYDQRSGDRRSGGRRSRDQRSGNQAYEEPGESSYDSYADSSNDRPYDAPDQEGSWDDSSSGDSSYDPGQSSDEGSDSGAYDDGARDSSYDGSSYDSSYDTGQGGEDYGQEGQERSGFLPLPVAPLLMLVLLVAMLVMTFYSGTIPEFTGALISSILIVTLIIYGAATLLKA
ncbi:MAG TPA: hypothetical protein VN455_12610 [Methanotrichaceae archaeon]|nr:hypothetical protein [Methanotrichaceae archaeon]